MKKLLIILFVAILIGCVDEPLPQKERITFNVTSANRRPFNGTLTWGLNAVEYSDKVVDLTLYASSFRAYPNDTFLLTITSNTEDFHLTFFRDREIYKTFVIKAGIENKLRP